MTAQSWARRHTEPAPPTRELLLCALLAALAALAIAPLAGQALVLLALTGEPGWPADPIRGLVELAHGRPGAGLPNRLAEQLPAPAVTLTVCLLTEAATLTLLVLATRQALRRSGHLGVRGLADPREATRALGVHALRRRGPVIRPDLRRGRQRRTRTRTRRRSQRWNQSS